MNVVYIVRCGDACKIGVTSNFENRLSQLRTDNPARIEVEMVINAGDDAGILETILHSRFRDSRIHSEWFYLSAIDLIRLRDEYSDRLLPVDDFNKARKYQISSRPGRSIADVLVTVILRKS